MRQPLPASASGMPPFRITVVWMREEADSIEDQFESQIACVFQMETELFHHPGWVVFVYQTVSSDSDISVCAVAGVCLASESI